MSKLKPMPHQRKALRWGRSKRSVALWMEMRLGKTLVSKWWADRRPQANRILVVAPLSALPSWREQLLEDGVPLEAVATLTGTAAQRLRAFERGDAANATWWLINYRGLTASGGKTRTGKSRAVPSAYAQLPWDVVILDESTRIKSPKAQVTRVVLEWLARAPYKACLSGMPAPESPEDYVCQMLFLHGEFMGCANYWDWRQRWMRPVGPSWTLTGQAVSELRRAVREASFSMRRKEAGMGSKLVRQTRHVELPAKVRRELQRAQEDLEVSVDDGRGTALTTNALTALTWCSQLTGGRFPRDARLHHDAKFRELTDLAKGDLRGEPLVVAATFTSEIHAATEALEKIGRRVVVVTGKSRKDNAERVERFRRGKANAIVAQPKCLQMGVDLSMASATIHLSRWWGYEVNAQFDARTDHPSRKDPRLVVDIVARDSIDEDKVTALNMKGASAKTFLRTFVKLASQRSKTG